MQKDPQFPPVSHAFFIVFASILFFTLLGQIWSGVPAKWEMFLLEISVIVPALIYIRIRKYSFRRIFRLHPVKGSILLASGLIGLGLSVVTEEINRLVQFVLPMPETLVKSLEQTLVFHSIPEFLVLVLGVAAAAVASGEHERRAARRCRPGPLAAGSGLRQSTAGNRRR